ncbi:hypothetical protein [Ruania zhangjianzhongii]|uniref:hypothetical protein n=1 Tax=Ruania zhangjianzhongii TaxID=2603206 RepID=UPI0011C82453|nr:hypothetical protein [Ruania zhangjianzhongii]
MRVVRVIVVLAALSMLTTGIWARVDPAGFAVWANWPNHVHFLHDAGVFQIGIALMMLLGLWWRDVIGVVLTGFIFTNSFHALNHALDLAHGGHAADSWGLLAISALAGVGLVARLRWTRRHRAADTKGERVEEKAR